jgi:hypothetical protein
LSELFPETHPRINIQVQRYNENYAGMQGFVTVNEIAAPCARCGALVLDREQHTDWHTSVDSSVTIALGGTR